MRKKLLALLMCATMVLGTGVTAMAATTDKEAKAIGSTNAQLIMDEYYKQAGSITGTAANGALGSVKYGYATTAESGEVLGAYEPVVIYTKDSKDYSATQVYSKGGKLKAYEAKAVGYDFTAATTTLKEKIEAAVSFKVEYVNYKNAAGTTVEATNVYSDNSGKDDKRVSKTTMNTGSVDESGNTYYDKDGNILVDVATYATKYKTATDAAKQASVVAATTSDVAVTVVDDNGATSLMWVKNGGADATTVDGFVDGTKNYVKKDSGRTLVTGADKFLKSVDEGKYGKIYSQLQTAGEGFADLQSIKYAVDSKKFTKDAAAVRITAFLQFPYATEDLGLENENALGAGKAKPLYNYTQIQAGTYTFDADLISRTAFGKESAVEVFQPGLVASEYVTELGSFVVPFNSIATVAVDDTITFDSDNLFVNGVFVFDKGEIAEEPATDANDGVSDTTATTPATDNAASPKTGDVAPIAALAVVMMGAFGAMVVASKKRA